MKKYYLLLFTFILSLTISAQNNMVSLNGENSYIDLGSSVAQGMRTVEFWFSPGQDIDNNLSSPKTILSRADMDANYNGDFALFFQPFFTRYAGKLSFVIRDKNEEFIVSSDQNSWTADQWYYVAIVIDAQYGMSMFIDGIKQSNTEAYYKAIEKSNAPSILGKWGDSNQGFFFGNIDEFNMSSEALYFDDFMKPCPGDISYAGSLGFYNFEDVNLPEIPDLCPNSYNAEAVNCEIIEYDICEEPSSEESLAMYFDGYDDYIDLGTDCDDGLRTIEMWFKLEEEINPQLDDYVALVAREVSVQSNIDEFSLFFQHRGVSQSGKLRFDIDATIPVKSVYSDNNTWEANRWYHVAAVIHPEEGMMMFIDGVKQQSTHPYTGATPNHDAITTIGRWGHLDIRHFKGWIDDVRFSDKAEYTEDFVPACDGMEVAQNTVAYYDFNFDVTMLGGPQALAFNQGSCGNPGIIFGAIQEEVNICEEISTRDQQDDNGQEEVEMKSSAFPNPSDGIFYVELEGMTYDTYTVKVYDQKANLKQSFNSKNMTPVIDLSGYDGGIYLYKIFSGSEVLYTGKLIKK